MERRRGGMVAAAVTGAVLATLVAPAGLNAAGGDAVQSADISDVGLVTPVPDDQVLVEAVERVRLELRACGLTSHLVDCAQPDALETEACVWARSRQLGARAARTLPVADALTEAVAAEPHAGVPPPLAPARPSTTAVVSFSRRARAVMVDAMASLPSGTKIFRLVHVAAPRGEGDPELLAIRAAELLRDVRLEVVRSAREEDVQRRLVEEQARAERAAPLSNDEAAATAVAVVEAPDGDEGGGDDDGHPPAGRGHRFSGWAVSAGAMVLQGRGASGATIAPTLGLVVPLPGHRALSFALMLAGPFFRDLQTAGGGSVATRQELGAVGARWGRSSGAVHPFAAVAVGAYHVRATRVSASAEPADAETMWAGAGAASGGLAVPLGRRLRATAEVGALFTTAKATILAGSDVIGHAGGPSLLCQVSLAAVLP